MRLNLSVIDDYWATLGGTDAEKSHGKNRWKTQPEYKNPLFKLHKSGK